jgi:hypothetical protein
MMATAKIDVLAPDFKLAAGSHGNIREGACLLEAVAYFAGKPFSDHPPCVSPVIAAFGRSWNDALDDQTRQKLKPYIPRMVGTAASKEIEERRAWLALDWSCRVSAPVWLRLAGLVSHAEALAALPPITGAASAKAAQATLDRAREATYAAWAAAWDAAGAAAGAAAWDTLKPTLEMLQASAFELLDRMIAEGGT